MAGFWIVPPPVALIEPVAVQEIPIDGIGGIYYATNGTLLIPLYREEAPLEAPGAPPQRVVKVKIFGSIANVPETIGMLARCLWPSPPIQPSAAPPTYDGTNVHVLK